MHQKQCARIPACPILLVSQLRITEDEERHGCIGQQPSLRYMEVVPARNTATLLPIIQTHVAPGTIVHSDKWAAYNQVGNLPNVGSYQTVNHSLHLVAGTPTSLTGVE